MQTNGIKVTNMLNQESSFKFIKTKHPFHLVDISPWPLIASLGAFMLTSGLVLYMHNYAGGWNLFLTGLCTILFVMTTWWRDVIREATFGNHHNGVVQRGLRLGVILFLLSEVMFFFAFFFAFFYSSVSPVFNIGGVWPPAAISIINTHTLPLTNSVLLLTSGAYVTWAHHAILLGTKRHSITAFLLTLFLAVLFLFLQITEYIHAPFNISDGIYGSCFYLLTGFHGFHVFVGAVALTVSLVRLMLNHFTRNQHLGLESAIWYWHFVDVVWLFLFISVYWWGNK